MLTLMKDSKKSTKLLEKRKIKFFKANEKIQQEKNEE